MQQWRSRRRQTVQRRWGRPVATQAAQRRRRAAATRAPAAAADRPSRARSWADPGRRGSTRRQTAGRRARRMVLRWRRQHCDAEQRQRVHTAGTRSQNALGLRTPISTHKPTRTWHLVRPAFASALLASAAGGCADTAAAGTGAAAVAVTTWGREWGAVAGAVATPVCTWGGRMNMETQGNQREQKRQKKAQRRGDRGSRPSARGRAAA